MNEKLFIGLQNIYFGYLFKFFSTKTSIFRLFQNAYVNRVSDLLSGYIIECGSSLNNSYKTYFKNYSQYTISNVNNLNDMYLDITNTGLDSNSVDGFVLVSVLEHVGDINTAVSEIHRVLRIGGKAIITIPVMYSIHGEEDFWRFNVQGIEKLFSRFKIDEFTVLGGIYSSVFNSLQRPKGNLRKRFIVNKLLAIPFFIMGKFFDRSDDFPLGYGFIIEKIES